MKKRIILLLTAVVMSVLLAACGSAGDESGEEVSTPLEPDRHHVEITIKDYGKISLELYKEVAPITVENFLKLAEDGFYDGLTFHRIIEGFMMQGGASEDVEVETIKGEFARNGVTNELSHTRGAISMARTNVYDSANSQFFIVHQDSVFLDGEYACFGYVTEGMDVVDAVCEAAEEADNGMIAREDQPVIESVVVID